MVGEPIAASIALIVVMLGAWLGAVCIGIYVVCAFQHGVDAFVGDPCPEAEPRLPTPSERDAGPNEWSVRVTASTFHNAAVS